MKTQSVFTYSLHTVKDSCHFKFIKTIQQKHKHSFSDLFSNNPLEQSNKQKIRRKSCYCNECGRISTFQYKFMNLKHQLHQNRNQSYTLHSSKEHLPNQNKFSIQLPNIQHIRKSQSSFRISRKSLLNEKSEEQRSPLMLYDSFICKIFNQYNLEIIGGNCLEKQNFETQCFSFQ
ncbi:unnamed protein product (macronuclear) [Paramecium tetraurelia]|uniref:Uncharacterized protein n=1 Tax=Paramecium tetraurelia TaxID=5888 RepID=A0CG90_PARTE|nr:uncharacterized protein GSPATT00038252001 [Paramecium tetraurelia]CAK69807.1 unnamed protein product [Paramecium tetraurelia]|eukprot:XP_001437204.1 hypothetical protein (macronuclear) [Paramecium tetraurelia strain d4-2]